MWQFFFIYFAIAFARVWAVGAEFLKRNNASRSLSCRHVIRKLIRRLIKCFGGSPYSFGFDLFQMVRWCLENVVVDVHIIFTFTQENCWHFFPAKFTAIQFSLLPSLVNSRLQFTIQNLFPQTQCFDTQSLGNSLNIHQITHGFRAVISYKSSNDVVTCSNVVKWMNASRENESEACPTLSLSPLSFRRLLYVTWYVTWQRVVRCVPSLSQVSSTIDWGLNLQYLWIQHRRIKLELTSIKAIARHKYDNLF